MELLSTSDLWKSSSSFPFVWHHPPPPLTGCCSASKSCLTLGNPVDCSTPGFPVFHCFLEFCSNSCPLRQWCCLTISSSAAPFSSAFSLSQHLCLFLLSWPFTSGGQSVGVSNEFSFRISLRIIGLISLQSKGLSRAFSSSAIWKHPFFGALSSLWSNSHIHTWLLEKP